MIWHMLENGYYKHTMANVTLWLSCYVYIFTFSIWLATVKQVLAMFYVSLERSPLDEPKKSNKPLRKKKCKKWERLTYFFKKQLYIHNTFVIEKWVNCRRFLMMRKTCKNFVWQENMNLYNHSSKSIFCVTIG